MESETVDHGLLTCDKPEGTPLIVLNTVTGEKIEARVAADNIVRVWDGPAAFAADVYEITDE